MRPLTFFISIPFAASLAVAPTMFSAAFAQSDDEIVFASGTGDVEDYDTREPVEQTDRSSDMIGMADKISDPAMQAGVARAVERMTATMMDLPVGNLAAAIEDARPGTVRKRIQRDATVADLAGRDAEYLPEELGVRSREAMGMMGGLARAMAMMMPEFEKMGREMEAGFKAAKAEARNR